MLFSSCLKLGVAVSKIADGVADAAPCASFGDITFLIMRIRFDQAHGVFRNRQCIAVAIRLIVILSE